MAFNNYIYIYNPTKYNSALLFFKIMQLLIKQLHPRQVSGVNFMKHH